MLRPQHVKQERGTSLWVAGELLSPREFTWPRDGVSRHRQPAAMGAIEGEVWATTRSQWRGIGIYALLFQRPLLGRPESVPPRLACAAQAPLPHPPIMVLRQLQHPDRPPEISPGRGPRKGTEGEWSTQGTPSLSGALMLVPRKPMATTHHTQNYTHQT